MCKVMDVRCLDVVFIAYTPFYKHQTHSEPTNIRLTLTEARSMALFNKLCRS